MSTKSIFLSCLCLWVTYFAQAQVPQLISYQAVARDVTGKVLSEKAISVQVEILQGSNSGSAAYAESHALTTTKTGTINLLIGGGDAINGTFTNIDWSNGPYFMKLSMKQDGETEYKEVSNTQMISVPYALYAEKAGTVVNGGNSGNSENMPKFTFVVTDIDNTPDDLYCILSGNLDKKGDEMEGHFYANNYISLEFTILYLDGQDQELMVSIEGLSGAELEFGQSSCAGRMFDLRYEDVPDGDYKLVVSNKDGNVVKEYPFTFKAQRSL